MDGNAEKNLNEIGEIKSMKGGGKGKGTPNGFRALVSEGTLALAFVTYFQMKKTENNIVK